MRTVAPPHGPKSVQRARAIDPRNEGKDVSFDDWIGNVEPSTHCVQLWRRLDAEWPANQAVYAAGTRDGETLLALNAVLAFQVHQLGDKIRVPMYPEDISRHLLLEGACHKGFAPKTQQSFGLSAVLCLSQDE